MDDIDIGYLAGIIDGEGTITLTTRERGNVKRSPVVSVASTDREILEWIQGHVGGGIQSKRTYQAHHRPSWAWKASGHRALDVLRLVEGLLHVPRKQARARLLLDDYIRLTPRNGRYTEDMEREKDAMVERFFAL